MESINFGYSIINNNNFAELDKDGFTIIKSDKDYWEKNNINFEYLSSITDELCKEGKSGGWKMVNKMINIGNLVPKEFPIFQIKIEFS